MWRGRDGSVEYRNYACVLRAKESEAKNENESFVYSNRNVQ